MPQQNDSILSETRATRAIYHVYSVYPLIAIVEYYEASCGGNSTGQCQHLPNWVPWFGISWGLAPIVEHLTTPFVCACWCKSHHLGVWDFILHWSIHTNTHLHPLCWLTKYHMTCESQLPNWVPQFGVSSGSSQEWYLCTSGIVKGTSLGSPTDTTCPDSARIGLAFWS